MCVLCMCVCVSACVCVCVWLPWLFKLWRAACHKPGIPSPSVFTVWEVGPLCWLLLLRGGTVVVETDYSLTRVDSNFSCSERVLSDCPLRTWSTFWNTFIKNMKKKKIEKERSHTWSPCPQDAHTNRDKSYFVCVCVYLSQITLHFFEKGIFAKIHCLVPLRQSIYS